MHHAGPGDHDEGELLVEGGGPPPGGLGLLHPDEGEEVSLEDDQAVPPGLLPHPLARRLAHLRLGLFALHGGDIILEGFFVVHGVDNSFEENVLDLLKDLDGLVDDVLVQRQQLPQEENTLHTRLGPGSP